MRRKGNRALVNEFLNYCLVHRGLERSTVNKYGLSYEVFCMQLGRTHFSEATPSQLREYVAMPMVKARRGRPAGSDPSPATKKRRVAELRSLYGWLHLEGHVTSNPALRLESPDVDNENPNPFPDPVWRDLWASDLTDSDRVGFGLAEFCGLRRFEATGLAPGHIGIHKGDLWLLAFKRKGGAHKNMPLGSCIRLWNDRRPDLLGHGPATFLEPLNRLLADRRDKPSLLDWQEVAGPPAQAPKYPRPKGFVDPVHFNRRLSRAVRALGIDPEGLTPHMLRHAFCTNLLNCGVNILKVSRLANHASVAVTQRYLKTHEDPLVGEFDDEGDDIEVKTFGPWG